MNKHELNEKMFDQALKYISEQKMDIMAYDFPSDKELESKIIFTSGFQKRMDAFFKKIKHKDYSYRRRKNIMKVGIVLSFFLVVCFTIVSNAEALRIPFLNFFNDINNNSTTIRVQDGDGLYSSFGEQIKGLYLPNYIPALYKVKSVNKIDSKYNVIFENTDGTNIKFEAMVGGSSTGVDSENINVIQIIVNGKQAQYYSKDGVNILIFEYDANTFILDGPIPKEELIEMAESLKFMK